MTRNASAKAVALLEGVGTEAAEAFDTEGEVDLLYLVELFALEVLQQRDDDALGVLRREHADALERNEHAVAPR